MRVTPIAGDGHTEVAPVRFRFEEDLFKRAMAARGHTTERARAAAAGVTRMTLYRWRYGLVSPVVDQASRVAAAAGLTVAQLFVEIPDDRAVA